ncbi:MAG: HlyD family type I secretion periplasmic adaptor subunit [Alphaproteobacteria bacterium]
MSRLDDVVARTPARFRRLAWLVMAFLVAIGVWAYFAELEEVAIAVGEVVPQGQVKVIQHLEGGIIEAIQVVDGDRVKAGDPLVQLDLTASGAGREELAVRLDSLLLTRARLLAEANGVAPAFPEKMAADRPELLEAERQAYQARQDELASSLRVLKEQARQRELAIAEMKAKRAAVTRDLEFAREELAMSQELVKDNLTPKIDHLKLQREAEQLEGELRTLEAGIPRAQAAIAEARERLKEERLKFRRVALDQLSKTDLAIAQTRETLARATDQVLRTEIRSPIDGVVKSLRYHTIGGVVRAGEPIMEIVPTGDNLVVEARLNPTDVGYVRVGQRAVVKIGTYDFVRYGSLDGEVIFLSADSHTDAEGGAYFRVVARTDKTYLGDAPGDLPIAPGMQATIDIHTGRKSVLNYLLKPVLKLRSEAFHER